MSEKDRSGSAFPNLRQDNGHGQLIRDDSPGLTKRELFAAMAMQGIVSADGGFDFLDRKMAKLSVQAADALLAELEK